MWSSDATCSKKASTCNSYVQNNPTAFAQGYWTINSVKVYQQPAAPVYCPTSDGATVATSSRQYAIHCGADDYGNDLYDSNGNIMMSEVDTFEGCVAKCDVTANCYAVSYNTYWQQCYLKDYGVPNIYSKDLQNVAIVSKNATSKARRDHLHKHQHSNQLF